MTHKPTITRHPAAKAKNTAHLQEAEKTAREHQLRSLQEELGTTGDSLSKANREKKALEEVNRKLQDDLHAEEDKLHHVTKARQKLEHALDEVRTVPVVVLWVP